MKLLVHIHLVPVLWVCLMLCACRTYFVVVLNQAQAQLCSSAIIALRCEHVHNVKCRPVRILQSRGSCHTFSSSSVMLSREIFLKTTSFPSLRLYRSTVLKREREREKKKLLFLSQVPFYKMKCLQLLSPFCILFHRHYQHLVSF